jgi:hypothetical protein
MKVVCLMVALLGLPASQAGAQQKGFAVEGTGGYVGFADDGVVGHSLVGGGSVVRPAQSQHRPGVSVHGRRTRPSRPDADGQCLRRSVRARARTSDCSLPGRRGRPVSDPGRVRRRHVHIERGGIHGRGRRAYLPRQQLLRRTGVPRRLGAAFSTFRECGLSISRGSGDAVAELGERERAPLFRDALAPPVL